MYNINNKYYKYLQELYKKETYEYNDNLLELILIKKRNLKKLLKLINIKGKINNIKISRKENIEITLTIKNENNKIIIYNKQNIKNTKEDAIKIYLSEEQEQIQNFICITYQTLYEKILSKTEAPIQKYIKQLLTPTTDEHYGLIITKKEKKYINKIIKNKDFIKSIKNNEFYNENNRTLNIILNKYLKFINNNSEINKILYKNGYLYKNTKYKRISDILLKMFQTLKEKGYKYEHLNKLINIYDKKNKLIASTDEIKQMTFPYYYDQKKYIEFDNKKYYIYTGWYKCDYGDLKLRINNLNDSIVDYSIIKI